MIVHTECSGKGWVQSQDSFMLMTIVFLPLWSQTLLAG